jgi:hypothetical protein
LVQIDVLDVAEKVPEVDQEWDGCKSKHRKMLLPPAIGPRAKNIAGLLGDRPGGN